MRCANLESGEFIQRSLENQVRERERSVERIADCVGQPAVAFKPVRELGSTLRVNEKQHFKLFRFRPDGVKFRTGEFFSRHAAADGGTAQSQLLDAFLELAHGEVRKLQRQRCKGNETVRV